MSSSILFSTLPQGNKKGPIKRWDFETEEDYHSYMESREALPKLVMIAIEYSLISLLLTSLQCCESVKFVLVNVLS